MPPSWATRSSCASTTASMRRQSPMPSQGCWVSMGSPVSRTVVPRPASAAIRVCDIVLSIVGLVALSPLLLGSMIAIWRQDGFSPLYVAKRSGLGGRAFEMFKLRSMVKNADKTGVSSTAVTDMRITAVGHFIRRYKLDELTQLWNVLRGDMSLVGPRPNVLQATAGYTDEEMDLLSVRPG